MSAEVESMSYVMRSQVDVPWHRLGEPVPPGTTLQDAATKAGIMWDVDCLPLSAHLPSDAGLMRVPGYNLVCRRSDRQIYGVMTDTYEPIQNARLVDFLAQWCDAGELAIETIGSLRKGAVIFLLAKMADSFQVGQDKTDAYLLVHSSHDRSLALGGQTTAVRVVCQNTLRAATEGRGKRIFSIRHTARAEEMIEHARKTVEQARDQFRQYSDMAARFAEHKLEPEQLLRFVGSLTGCITDPARLLEASTLIRYEDLTRVGQDIVHAVEHSPGAGLPAAQGTLYGALHGVTYYVDHTAGRNAESRLDSAWFGLRSGLKDLALTRAVELVKVR